ncbi:MAG: hypothetical protein AAFY38_16580 [Pseudomonadota bacterium]
MSRVYYIHAGAHRTGSSSFQMCLHVNRDALDAAGYDLAYPGRDGIPSGRLDLRLPSPRHGAGPHPVLVQRSKAALGDGDRPMILSEENIAGRMFHFYQGQFYPAAEARCRALKDALNGPVARLVLVIRPYAGLYASAFRKRAEDNPVRPFREVVPQLMTMDRGWPELVALMRDVLAPEAFEVVPFAVRGASRDLLYRLVPEAGAGWTEPEEVVNLSATDAALEALQARYHAGDALDRAAWKAVIAKHAGDTGRGFAAFTDAERNTLDTLYNRDLLRISEMDGVSLAPSAPV